jgi:hypothetical protein
MGIGRVVPRIIYVTGLNGLTSLLLINFMDFIDRMGTNHSTASTIHLLQSQKGRGSTLMYGTSMSPLRHR